MVEVYLHGVRTPFIDVVARLASARKSQVVGLLGNVDGDPANDLATRDGTLVDIAGLAKNDIQARLYRDFGDSWRVSEAESLFDYKYKRFESTSTHTKLDCPSSLIAASDQAPDEQSAAEANCREGGVTEASLLIDCILDFRLTNELEFAASAVVAQNALAVQRTQHYRTDIPPDLLALYGPIGAEFVWIGYRAEILLDLATNRPIDGLFYEEWFNQRALDREVGEIFHSIYDAREVRPSEDVRFADGILFAGTLTVYYSPPEDPPKPFVGEDVPTQFEFAIDDARKFKLCGPVAFLEGSEACLAEPNAVLAPVQ